MDKKILNFAVVGSRKMFKTHMRGMVTVDCAKLIAVCDICEDVASEAAANFGLDTYYTNHNEMLKNEDIDVVIVATSDQTHREITVDCLNAGKHVLCEKPMALTLDDCKAMIKAANESGKKLMVGQICRHAPGFALAKQLVSDGEIGDIFFVESEYAHDYSGEFGQDNWRIDPINLRHAVIGGGCHAVDLLRWIAGNPVEVSAYANRKSLTDWPVDDCTVAIMQFQNNVIGKVMTSIGCKRKYTMRTVIYGTKGTIVADNTSPTISIFKDEMYGNEKYKNIKQQVIEMKLPVSIESHNTAAEIKEICDAILNDKELITDGVEGASTVAVCNAIVESSANGERIKLDYNF